MQNPLPPHPIAPPPANAPAPGTLDPVQERNWAMGCHLAALSGFIGVPYGNVVGPLVVWMLARDKSEFIDRHGKESLNFHIMLAIYLTISLFAMLFLIGFLMFPIIYLGGLLCTVQAATKAANGEHYLYPFSFQFFK